MKSKIFPFFLVIIFFVIFSIFYKGLQNSNIYIPESKIKKDIPIFEAKSLLAMDKKNLSKEIFENDEFYLMNIWSSWCVPCKDEHPFLMSLKNQKNIQIIGLNYKDKIGNAKNFLKELGNPYKHILLDEEGVIAIEWGAYGVPESFLIYDKKIIKKIIGPIDKDLFLEIKELIR